MGGASGTSSKRKSSSSLKKKRSHNSSQFRKRKRSRSRSRRNKSKKLRRHDDSISYSDDDDSRSSVSISSSSSDDGTRRRRSRSRTRRDVKRSKKSTTRNSSSSESSRDARPIKKRKRSKKNANLATTKKSRGKKKPKRDVSVSSTSRSSRSCSTCRGDSSNGSGKEREYAKGRGRSDKKERGKRDVGKRGIKRSGHRSRSSSSCSRSSKANGYQSEEKLVGENNPTRLRSVIIVAKQPEEKEERELDKDGHKEEIIYDHDEYPSCRSNDSNDGGTKSELHNHSHVATSHKKNDENVKGEQGIRSSVRTTEIALTGIDEEDRYDGSYPCLDVVEANNRFREKNIGDSAAIGSPDNVDLESILRQKALKNLRKFRGGLKIKTATCLKEKNEDDIEQPSTAKTDLLSHKEDGARVLSSTHEVDVDQINGFTTTKVAARSSQNDKNNHIGGYSKTRLEASELVQVKSYKEDSHKPWTTNEAVDRISMARVWRNSSPSIQSKTRPEASELVQIKSYKEDSHEPWTTNKAVDQLSMARVRRNSSPSIQDDRKLQDGYFDGTDSGSGRQDVNRPPRLVMTGRSKASENTSADAVNNKSPKDKQLVSKDNGNDSAAETAKTLPNSSNINGEQVDNASGSADPDRSSCLKPASGILSSKELQGEAKEGSQYEQKTMSVMRGGEMVQVSYKVYIPKKTPALARRKLRR